MRNPAFSVNAMVPLMQFMDWDKPTANPNNWQKELGNKVMGEFPPLVKDAGAGLRLIQPAALQSVIARSGVAAKPRSHDVAIQRRKL